MNLKQGRYLQTILTVYWKKSNERRRLPPISCASTRLGRTRLHVKAVNLTKRAVTKQLTASFSDELEALRFHHVEVQLVDAGASRGALYHRLKFRRAPDADVSKVVSEGEARCLSIASFFAELSTATDRSAILFGRSRFIARTTIGAQSVAKRLVVESKSRQVIVFTHDHSFPSCVDGER